ncbi:MAG: acyl carrier protein [Burkholderiaceae bacterium]|nr:acyl carrier protein [Burkholderiaceae bacterium]
MISMHDQFRQFLLKNFYVTDASTLLDDTSLMDSGIVDSTGMLEIIGFIEESFGVRIADADMVPENLDSIGQVVAFVQRKLG